MDPNPNKTGVSQPELRCQSCGSTELERVLDLGYQPLCNEFVPIGDPIQPQTYYPLCLCYCHQCTLVQLDYVIPTQHAFGDQYTYLTGSSRSLVEYFSDLAGNLAARFDLHPGDAVVEIGANDGTFLKAFQDLGMNVLGIEGARQASSIAVANGIPVIEEFFGKGMAAEVKNRLPDGAKIRLVLGMNVLAHTDNINEFLPEVVELMEPGVVFVSQSHWLLALIQKFEFDTIYHEHLRYYTLGSLTSLFQRHGLNINDAETNDFYGGSILVYASTDSDTRSDGVLSVLEEEKQTNVFQSLKDMKQVLLDNKYRLLSLLVDLKNSGKRVTGIGAPMKASTLLNFYGVTSDLVEYIGEVNQLKVGTVVPGVRIPVVDEKIMFEEQPDYAILLSWNMAEHIVPKFREMGYRGKFILPVPHVEVV